jgi:GxxExxY protein
MTDYILKDKTYAIIGACIKVHNTLGSGFVESVYQEALEKEFVARNIDFIRQKRLKLYYDGQLMTKYFIADFLCFKEIVLEIKAVDYVINEHQRQLLNYLKASRLPLGLLVNFGRTSLQVKRLIN